MEIDINSKSPELSFEYISVVSKLLHLISIIS